MSLLATQAASIAGLLDGLAAGPLAITHLPSGGGGPLFAQADWLLAIGALAAAHYLYHAFDAIEIERVTLQREIEALDAFIARVESLAGGTVVTTGGVDGSTVAANQGPSGPPIRSIRECYEETVMSMPHYEEAYGEPLAESVERELGPQYAAVLSGSGHCSTPLLQGLIVQATQAKRERETVLEAIDAEESSLERARSAFADVEDAIVAAGPRALNTEPFDQLQDKWDRLGEARDRCERVLSRRQREVQEQTCRRRPEGDPVFLQDFLYDSLSVRFPVLERGSTLVGQIDSSRGRLVDALTTRT